MSSVEQNGLRSAQYQGEDGRDRYSPPTSQRSNEGPSWELLFTGLVVVGLGVLAWTYLEPDIRRYLKIRNM